MELYTILFKSGKRLHCEMPSDEAKQLMKRFNGSFFPDDTYAGEWWSCRCSEVAAIYRREEDWPVVVAEIAGIAFKPPNPLDPVTG